MSRLILALDPSAEHTGCALFDEVQLGRLRLIGSATLPVLQVLDWADLARVTEHPPVGLLLIERPASGPRLAGQDGGRTIGAYWHLVWSASERWPGCEVRSIGPGSWKPAASRIVREVPAEVYGPHARDAYAMAIVSLAGRKSPNG